MSPFCETSNGEEDVRYDWGSNGVGGQGTLVAVKGEVALLGEWSAGLCFCACG